MFNSYVKLPEGIDYPNRDISSPDVPCSTPLADLVVIYVLVIISFSGL